MPNRAFLAAAATLLAGCASGGPAPGQSAPPGELYRYGVPTPPTATYRLGDTTTMIMTMPEAEMDMTMSSASTIELAFVADPGGVRATGTVSNYSSGVSSAMMGNADLGGDGPSGDLEFVIGPLGEVEMVSTPEITGTDLPIPIPFQLNTRDLFPRFPDRPLRPGDTWADTASTSVNPGPALGLPMPTAGTVESTTIYNYTLVGDTLVDGRTLRKIALSSIEGTQATAEQVGGAGATDMISVLDGFILWDPARGLVAAVDLVRTMDGSMSVMGSAATSVMAGPTKLRLVN